MLGYDVRHDATKPSNVTNPGNGTDRASLPKTGGRYVNLIRSGRYGPGVVELTRERISGANIPRLPSKALDELDEFLGTT